MGTDPTPPEPGTEAAPTPDAPAETTPAPGTDTPPADASTGTEPAPPPAAPGAPEDTPTPGTEEPPADTPPAEGESDTSGEGEVVEESVTVTETETVVYDATAPAGHVQTDEDGNPRQHGDLNPEVGKAPDALPGTGTEPTPPPDEFEPEQVEIDRPDVGTPVTDEPPAGSVVEEPAEGEGE